MNVPELVRLGDYDASHYLDEVYKFFVDEVANARIEFLGLPITCPWHPPTDNKHFSFWHVVSSGGAGIAEEDRMPDMRRCEQIRWIAYVLQNASDKNTVWCWEKSVKTSRGRSIHVMLYLHRERYLVVLRRKQNRLELVTAYEKRGIDGINKERTAHADPR